MNTLKLKIPNSKGVILNARVELPRDRKATNFAIFAHCFTCHSNLNSVRHISRTLSEHGFGVVRFDFTGLGHSEGEFSDSHFSANVDDLVDVHAYISEHYMAPTLLVGHSLGGAAVIVAADRLDDIKAVCTIAAPATVEHVTHLFSHAIDEVEEKGEVKVNIGGRPFQIDRDFVADFNKTDLPAIIRKLKKPILILHSPFDNVVGIENANKIFHNAFHPKSFVSLGDADHLLTKREDSIYVGDVIGGWVKRYFPMSEDLDLDPEQEQVVGSLNVVEDNFTTYIHTQRHKLVADEPESFGGDDYGPSPYELLNSALVACSAMTVKLYAKRKKWDLHEVVVYTTHSKKHVQDMDNPDKKIYLDHIVKKIKFFGNLDDKQRTRLKEIASRCPVHRSLLNEVVIETELID